MLLNLSKSSNTKQASQQFCLLQWTHSVDRKLQKKRRKFDYFSR